MNPKPLTALKACIEHWRRFAEDKAGPEETPYADDCALCGLFLEQEDRCCGCPIREKTGLPVCDDTPWLAAVEAWEQNGERTSVSFRKKAKKMVRFLTSLLPEEHQ